MLEVGSDADGWHLSYQSPCFFASKNDVWTESQRTLSFLILSFFFFFGVRGVSWVRSWVRDFLDSLCTCEDEAGLHLALTQRIMRMMMSFMKKPRRRCLVLNKVTEV